MLMREPYGKDTVPVEAFDYEERVDGTDHAKYLWGNAAWALGARITQAFATYGWCATIRGVESGGLVEGLPVHNFRTESGDIAMKCPTETPITDRREKELADLGFAPLVHWKGTRQRRVLQRAVGAEAEGVRLRRGHGERAHLGAAAVHLRRVALRALSEGDHARQDRRVHVARRDRRRSSTTGSSNYVVANDDAGFAMKAKHPLKEARVEVVGSPGQAGRVSRRRVPPSALPARRAVDVDAVWLPELPQAAG